MQKFQFKSIVRHGLLGSVIALYFSVIGMVEAFGSRDLIGEYLNLGHLLLFGGIIWSGFAVTTGRRKAGWLTNLVSATLAGAVAGVLPLLLVLANRQIELREVFVNVNPNLMSILTFERADTAGLLLLLGVSAAGGLLGGLYNILHARIRKAIGMSVTVTLLMAIFADLVIQVLSNVASRETTKLFYVGDSMKPAVAVVLFAALAALFYARQTLADKRATEGTVSTETKKAQLRTRIFQFVGFGIVLLIAPWVLGSFLSQVLFEIGRFVLLGLGLNIVVGYAGLLDLGYVAFFAFGAYTMGVLTTTGPLNPAPGLFNFWTALPIVVLVGVFFGVILGFPVLRMRGDYLAIVTLGFGEIIRILALSDWLSPIMGGAQGVLKIPNPVLFGVEFNSPERMYYLVLF
ncbi:MAG: leucine/isoleucine/valine transporter permease subunit, partial [Chloroflexi bacterium]|nr:leucine/isoleucine/valine transporter permease subunit [Chloroflexota bacterium]